MYVVQHEQGDRFLVQARSPAAAVREVANRAIPSQQRFGGTLRVTRVASGQILDSPQNAVCYYRVSTNRVVERVTRCVSPS